MIGLKDNDVAMFVMNDRAMGGTSIKPGRLELCINRKTAGNDAGGITRGVNMDGEIETEFLLHFEWRRDRDNQLMSISELFSKLLRKSL